MDSIGAESDPATAPPVPPKRSLFKKSQWAAQVVETDEAVDFFSRAKELFPTVVAENEKRRKESEKTKRKSGSLEREESVNSDKKRRVSVDTEDDLGAASSDDEIASRILKGRRTSSSPGAREVAISPIKPQRGSPSRKSHSDPTTKPSNTRIKSPSQSVISLSDSDDDIPSRTVQPTTNLFLEDDEDDEDPRPASRTTKVQPVEKLSDDDDDDFLAKFVAKAREGAKRKPFSRLDVNKAATIDSSSDGGSTPKSIGISLSRSPIPDPIILILVTSQIDGTVPIILKRKLSQRLKDVRIAWCDKQLHDGQPLPHEVKNQIFLTWRGSKVFDVTTCNSFGLRIDAGGKLRGEGDGFDSEGRIHLEAWTEELFDEARKKRQAKRLRHAQDPMEEEDEPVEEVKPAAEPSLKIILKAKDYPDFKIMVKPHTLVSKMISAFRSQYKIALETEIDLRFDGDRLEPESAAGDADLEDLTTVDVYVH